MAAEGSITELQRYLRRGGSITTLHDRPYCLKIIVHDEYPNLHLFKYDQRQSDFSHPMVREARGIILDADDDWNVVSYPYDKFFNHGELLASDIDWETSSILEKKDGSLMVLYYYRDEWQVSSSGRPNGDGIAVSNYVGVPSMTFAQLFWKVWKDLEYTLPDDKTVCYMFELISPWSQIVVAYPEADLVIHGARCLRSLKEIDPAILAKKYSWRLIRSFDFVNVDALITFTSTLKATEAEGFVVRDSSFRRIKVKAPEYVAKAHCGKTSACPNGLNLIQIIQTEEVDEIVANFPNWEEPLNDMRRRMMILVVAIEDAWTEHRHHTTPRSLGLAIKGQWYCKMLFDIYKKKINAKDIIWNMRPKTLLDLIKART